MSTINENEGYGPKTGRPKSTGESFASSGNDLPNDISQLFTTKEQKWFQKYPMLFQFYLVHGHTNAARNYGNSLAEWASYQRTKLVKSGDKYDPTYKHNLGGIDFSFVSPPTPNKVFYSNLDIYNSLRGNRNAITPKKEDKKGIYSWYQYWCHQGKHFYLVNQANSKRMIRRKYLLCIPQAFYVVFHLL
jgi:hypothetical protein